MSLFDNLVNNALKNQPDLSPLRIVVEKEILHHDILRILSNSNMLANLTFIGGTALRICYGSLRLSEDLDFTGGENFSKEALSDMGDILVCSLNTKYGLDVTVSEPIKDNTNVSTWKIKVKTRSQQKHFPEQRINIDICAMPSYEKEPMMLLNPYAVDMGTNGLIIQTQSMEEIYMDKLLALALRPNRIKYRDLWDIIWLNQQGLKPRFELFNNKLKDRKLSKEYFLSLLKDRIQLISSDKNIKIEFHKEMNRFLPAQQINIIIKQDNFWTYIINLLSKLQRNL